MDQQFRQEQQKAVAASDFIAQFIERTPTLFEGLVNSAQLHQAIDWAQQASSLKASLNALTQDGERGQQRVLRQFRNQHMVRIAWRDINDLAPLNETLYDLSKLADVCLALALEIATAKISQRAGTPRNADGDAQQLVVLGMGKLGGYELNYSSDIDLIFCYPDAGQTDGPKRMDNGEYFIRVAQHIIKLIDTITADGFVFRVDTRLRPFGRSGALAMSFDAMEAYYHQHGRDWERYALIKARPIAGDIPQGDVLLRTLRPFIYRRYFDYSIIAGLRDMKAMIETELKKKGLGDNIKLGPGGIREIEFIAQTWQLVRGGHETELQGRELQPVLKNLQQGGHISSTEYQQLIAAYTFLRTLENRFQALRDAQTHTIPESAEDRERIAIGMNFADWQRLETTLNQHRAAVHQQFKHVFFAQQHDDDTTTAPSGSAPTWLDPSSAEATSYLSNTGYAQPLEVQKHLQHMRQGRLYEFLEPQAHALWDQLIPLLIDECASFSAPDTALRRVLGILETIGRRTTYLALLAERPLSRQRLITLCAASPWITQQIALHPILLDELLNPNLLNELPSREQLAADLRQELARLDEGDKENQLDVLRTFRHANVLRVAAVDVTDALPLMKVSDHLTDIAETVLSIAIDLAWEELTQRYGIPSCKADADSPPRHVQFAVIAYGKLGGWELGYGSDLDVVFLHNSSGKQQETTGGPRVLANDVFFARLSQSITHYLSVNTRFGQAYEIDMRLRPSGSAGLLVTSIEGFAQYQEQNAWTWEHQALVRARAVYGQADIVAAFQAIRHQTLCAEREPTALRDAIVEMRAKMQSNLDKSTEQLFDLKQGKGGITDIEFMVQYAVLRWSSDHPALTTWSDNIRILDDLARLQLLDSTDADALAEAYRCLRRQGHKLALQERSRTIAADLFSANKATVQRIWQQWFGQ